MSTTPAGMHRLLLLRERGHTGPQDALDFERSLHFPVHFVNKMSVEHTYEGHNGCVNRLGWNADGSLLVSGSDDRRAIIWHYPDVDRPALAVTTEHRANLFGVQFLPCSSDRRIITGAMDNTVQLHDLEASPAAASASTAAPGGRQSSAGAGHAMRRHGESVAASKLINVTPRTRVYCSHKDRVKDVKVEQMNPHNFWSGGEDGDVRQYDTRMPNQDNWGSPTVLVQIRDGHRTVQVKSLDINKAHPHLMAVAGNDPYIRLYDRRKLSPGSWKRRGATETVMQLVPPHLPLAAAARTGRAHATYVAFSNRGDKVVTTYHADHAYCFDITSSGDMAALFPQPAPACPRPLPGRLLMPGSNATRVAAAVHSGAGPHEDSLLGESGMSSFTRSSNSSSSPPLPPRAEEAKARGNTATFERNWVAAVRAFSDALHFAPGSPVLYALRAEALLRRAWVGDAALALRDCDIAVVLGNGCSRAFLSRIHALQALQQYQCALTAVDEYRLRFPGRAADDLAKLVAQLRAAVEERRRSYEARKQQQERRRVQRSAVQMSRVQEALARTPRRAAASPPPLSPPLLSPPVPRQNAGISTIAATSAPRRPRTSAPNTAITDSAPVGVGISTGELQAAVPVAEEEQASAAAAAATTVGVLDSMEVEEAPASAAAVNVAVLEEARQVDVAAQQQHRLSDALMAQAAGKSASPLVPATNGSCSSFSEGCGNVDGGDASVREGWEDNYLGSATAIAPSGLNPQTPREVDVGLDGASENEENEEEGIVDGTRHGAAIDNEVCFDVDYNDDNDENREERRGVEDEVAGATAARARAPSDSEYDSEYDSEVELLSRGVSDGCEEDPDLELFLQYYACAMELAGGSGTNGGPGSGRGGGGGEGATSSPRLRGGVSGGAATAAAVPTALHVPGAWGGSAGGRRMLQRYVGQCNVQTDIKEVNFVGSDDRVVAAGSDCGRVFLYDAHTGAVLRALQADEEVANCVQCHPTLPILATSGIENIIRLWSPRDEPPTAAAASELEEQLCSIVEENQRRMREGPAMFRFRPSMLQDALQENPQLLHLFMSQLYGRAFAAARGPRAGPTSGVGDTSGDQREDEEEEDEEGNPEVSCRMA